MAKNGLVFITKSTFTTAASVSIDSCFSATYTHYVIKRNLLGSGAGNAIHARLRVGGVDASAANYRRQLLYGDSTTVAGVRSTGDVYLTDALGYTEATSFGYSELWISNPFETVRTTAWVDLAHTQTGNMPLVTEVYAHDLATSYDGITFFPGAGTITGSISIFGLVKS